MKILVAFTIFLEPFLMLPTVCFSPSTINFQLLQAFLEFDEGKELKRIEEEEEGILNSPPPSPLKTLLLLVRPILCAKNLCRSLFSN